MKPKLIIVTGNPMKFEQLSSGLAEFFDCEQGQVEGYEIQGSPEEILRHKLEQAFEKHKQPVLVDDTSLHFETLGGFPGPYVRDFFNALKSWEMGERLAGSGVEAVCRIGLCLDKDKIIIGEGKVKGRVVKPKEGDHWSQDFDIFLMPEGKDRTMNEFTQEEKLKFSHRGNAMRDLLKKLMETFI